MNFLADNLFLKKILDIFQFEVWSPKFLGSLS